MKTAIADFARQMPGYQQDLERTRAATHLSGSPVGGATLTYRYDDGGETVTVPNLWRNQTIAIQVSELRRLSIHLDAQARGLLDCPMLAKSAAENATRVQAYQRRAHVYRLLAARLVLLGEKAALDTLAQMEQLLVKVG
jgi:hypothetical protein